MFDHNSARIRLGQFCKNPHTGLVASIGRVDGCFGSEYREEGGVRMEQGLWLSRLLAQTIQENKLKKK